MTSSTVWKKRWTFAKLFTLFTAHSLRSVLVKVPHREEEEGWDWQYEHIHHTTVPHNEKILQETKVIEELRKKVISREVSIRKLKMKNKWVLLLLTIFVNA